MEAIKKEMMEKVLPDVFEDEKWAIQSDKDAEFVISCIGAERKEMKRLLDTCQGVIDEYLAKMEQIKARYGRRTGYLTTLLHQYFTKVPHRITSTQAAYRLPGGVLRLKTQEPEFVRDEQRLVEWLKVNGLNDFIEAVEKPKWGEFKKQVEVSGERAVERESGMIVAGVTVVDKPPVFEVDIRE